MTQRAFFIDMRKQVTFSICSDKVIYFLNFAFDELFIHIITLAQIQNLSEYKV